MFDDRPFEVGLLKWWMSILGMVGDNPWDAGMPVVNCSLFYESSPSAKFHVYSTLPTG